MYYARPLHAGKACMIFPFTLLYVLIFLVCGIPANSQITNKKTYYVAGDGDDSSPGTIDHPFKTLAAAIDAVNKITGPVNASIEIRQGVYSLNESLILAGKRSDTTRSFTFSGYKNEKITIIGGSKLDNSKFKIVKDPNILNRLPAIARGKVYVTDMKDQGITDFGTMKDYGFGAPELPPSLELFFNDEPLTLSRWPNSGVLPIGKVIKRGNKKNKEPSVFMYDNFMQPDKWSQSTDKWIAGIFGVGWAYDYLPIDSIDTKSKTIYLKDAPSYGLYESTDSSTHIISGARKSRGFYFFNILEEIDMPGEWYLDRPDGKLYIWPPGELTNAIIYASILEEPMFKIIGISNISFKNISFASCRGIAVKIDNANNILFTNCDFSNTGLKAISAWTSSNVHISNCKFAHTGSGGIWLTGGDRKKLIPANNSVSNCEFYDYSRLYRCYAPAVGLGGVSTSITNCYIHDAPDQAIVFLGNNHIISYNHIQNVCYGFSDMGSIYTGRDPSSAGTIITNNYFDSIQNSTGAVTAVYIDDGSGGIGINNNLFYSCGSAYGAVHINGGGNIKLENNVFVDCIKAITNNPWDNKGWINLYIRSESPYSKMLTKTVDIRSDVYLKQYPYLQNFFDTVNMNPRINYISNTILFNTKTLNTGNSFVISNTFSTDTNPGFADVNKKNFTMISIPREVQQWQGWSPVEFDKIGIK
jgi:Right handed beta helix region